MDRWRVWRIASVQEQKRKRPNDQDIQAAVVQVQTH